MEPQPKHPQPLAWLEARYEHSRTGTRFAAGLAHGSAAPARSRQSEHVLEGDYYSVETTAREDARLAVVSGGREHCSPEYEVSRSSFEHLAIEFVPHGEGSLSLAGKSYSLIPGTLFRYGPGVPHVIRARRGKPLVRYFVHFTGWDALPMIEQAWSGAFVVQTADRYRVKTRFEELASLAAQRHRSTARLSALALEQLVLEVGDGRWSDDGIERASYQSYRRSRDYLEEHYLAVRNLAELAKACHLTQTYLCRLFHRYEGCSPYKRLLRMKMDHAAARLRDPSVSVKCAGAEVGFEDPYHFSKAFKQVLGMPPTRFRDR